MYIVPNNEYQNKNYRVLFTINTSPNNQFLKKYENRSTSSKELLNAFERRVPTTYLIFE